LINYSQTQPVAIEIHRKNKNQTNLKRHLLVTHSH